MAKTFHYPHEAEKAKTSPLLTTGEHEQIDIYFRVRISVPKGMNPDSVMNILTGMMWREEPHIDRIHIGEWQNKAGKIVYIE